MILQPFGHHYRGNRNKAFFFTMLTKSEVGPLSIE